MSGLRAVVWHELPVFVYENAAQRAEHEHDEYGVIFVQRPIGSE